MDFYDKVGTIALGSRLRRLGERLTDEATQIYTLYDIGLQPSWFPVFYMLSQGEEKSISQIAVEIGHSQPSVSKIVREMAKRGLVSERKGTYDKRKNVVSLSDAGVQMGTKIQEQYGDLAVTVDAAMAETDHNLWKAITEWEYLLDQKSLFTRMKEQKKSRESAQVELVDYTPAYKQAFRDLNVEWISQYFTMEAADYRALDHPEEYILDKGGYIGVALWNGEAVGVCALIKMDHPRFDFELAKMAVSPKAQGKSIGFLLGRAMAAKAKEMGGKSLYLESNTILKPAINLYHKLGFEKIVGIPSPYERCNIQMELKL